MSDGQAPAPAAAAPAAPAAPATPAPSSTPSQVQGGSESVLDTDLPQGDSFPRDYVEKLRKEAADHRTKYKGVEPWGQFAEEFKGHFSGPDDLREFLGNFQDPQRFIQWFAQTAQQLPPEVLQQVFGPEPDPNELNRPLTVQEFAQFQQQQMQQAQMAQEDQVVESTLKELGLSGKSRKAVIALAMEALPGIRGRQDDPTRFAQALQKGYEAYQELLNEHVNTISSKDEANRARTPGSISGGVPPVPGEDKPAADFKEARQRAMERVRGARRADNLT